DGWKTVRALESGPVRWQLYFSFSPDGRTVAGLTGTDGEMGVVAWGLETGKRRNLATYRLKDAHDPGPATRHLVFTPDETGLAVHERGTGWVIRDVGSGKVVYTFRERPPAWGSGWAQFTRDGKTLF